MRQIVFFSTAAGRQDAITMAGILAVSRGNNLRADITGLLVASGHRYLQVMEGPKSTVDALIERIRHDRRHVGMSVLVDRRTIRRSFADWSMVHCERAPLGEYATLAELVDQVRRVTGQKLHDQLDCFERRFATAAIAPVASPWTLATTYGPGLALDGSH